jgi:hypothetical protein
MGRILYFETVGGVFNRTKASTGAPAAQNTVKGREVTLGTGGLAGVCVSG